MTPAQKSDADELPGPRVVAPIKCDFCNATASRLVTRVFKDERRFACPRGTCGEKAVARDPFIQGRPRFDAFDVAALGALVRAGYRSAKAKRAQKESPCQE